MKIVFFGTPPFAARVLDHLITHDVDVVAVVTKPDKPKGRSGNPLPTAVKELVNTKYPNLPLHQPALISSENEVSTLLPYQADLFIVVAYGEIIKQHLLDMPKHGCINVHASLLPKYRGAAPIQQAIIHGETESGVTIMYMVKKMDAGDMIETAIVPIDPEMTFGELEEHLCRAGCETLLRVIKHVEQGDVKRLPQNHEQATFAPKIELEDCKIDWTQPAQVIHNLVRGVNPYPGAWCILHLNGEQKRLKIRKTRCFADRSGQPGHPTIEDKSRLIIACGENAIELLELQPEGKKMMLAGEWLRGLPKDVDFSLS